MKDLKRVNSNPAEQSVANFLAATNAYAEQQRQLGLNANGYLSALNAKDTYRKLIKAAVALVNPASEKHNEAFAEFSDKLGGSRSTAFNAMENIGEGFLRSTMAYAQAATKAGMSEERAVEAAFNSLAGNPVFDHFGNLNLLAGQLFEEMAFYQSWLENGDAFAVPVESGGTNLDKTRFRAPYEVVTGSAKTMQGDINPMSHLREDANRIQIDLYNEFKNAQTLEAVFSITQAQRDQALGYAASIAPALAGFILQNRYFAASQKHVMKQAELRFVDGLDALGNYTAGVGGSYGILSPAIQLKLSDWDAASPAVATGADFAANSGKLIQKIQNHYAKPASVSAQLPTSLDPANVYKDIIRLVNLYALQNVDFKPKQLSLFVPTSIYGLLMQYPSGGTFNKQLNEMITTATSGIVTSIKIIPSSLCNYRAANSYGSTDVAYNYMVLVAQGCEQEKKPIIMPGQTAVPYVTSENVSATIMNFRTQMLYGGPMVMQLGGAFILEFSKAA